MLILRRLICHTFRMRHKIADCRNLNILSRGNCTNSKYSDSLPTFEGSAFRRRVPRSKISRRLQQLSTDAGSVSGIAQTGRPWSKTCECCGRNPKGDKELADFLKVELEILKECFRSNEQLPEIQGFHISKVSGSSVDFKRKMKDETITVKVNINKATEVDESGSGFDSTDDFDDNFRHSGPLLCRPPLLIEISKENQKTLGLKCNILDPDEFSALQDFYHNENMAPLEIHEFAVYKKPGDWDDDVYSALGDRLEEKFHRHLHAILLERSIDRIFIEELLDFTSYYEHRLYVSFLEDVKNFLTCTSIV